jgi:predicted DNA-binding transcriptional regulator AlpA
MMCLLTEQQVADQLTMSLSTLRRRRLSGHGPRFMKVASLVHYRPEEIETWLELPPSRWIERRSSRLDTGEFSSPQVGTAQLLKAKVVADGAPGLLRQSARGQEG